MTATNIAGYRCLKCFQTGRLSDWNAGPCPHCGHGRAEYVSLDDLRCDEHPDGCGEHCQDCGRGYSRTLWHAPDDLWAQLVAANGSGLLCPRCFSDRALKAGIRVRFIAEALPVAGSTEPATEPAVQCAATLDIGYGRTARCGKWAGSHHDEWHVQSNLDVPSNSTPYVWRDEAIGAISHSARAVSGNQDDQPNQSVNMRSSEDPYDKAARLDQPVTITQADVVTIEMPRTLEVLSGDTISLRWRGRVVSVDGVVTLTTATPVVAGAVIMWTLDDPDVESDYELTPDSVGRWRLQVPIEPGEPVAVVLRGREQPRERPVSE